LTTKDEAKGILLGVVDVGGDVQKAAGQLGKGAVKGAVEIGGDVGEAAKSAVGGAIDAVRRLG